MAVSKPLRGPCPVGSARTRAADRPGSRCPRGRWPPVVARVIDRPNAAAVEVRQRPLPPRQHRLALVALDPEVEGLAGARQRADHTSSPAWSKLIGPFWLGPTSARRTGCPPAGHEQ